MDEFKYIQRGNELSGQFSTVNAPTPEQAIATAPNIAPTSGVLKPVNVTVPNVIPSQFATTPATLSSVPNRIQELRDIYGQTTQDINALTGQLENYMTPSDAERSLQQRITDLGRQESQRMLDVERSGKLRLGIQGEQERIQRQAQAERIARSEELQALASQRQSIFDAIKTKIGLKQQNLEDLLNFENTIRGLSQDEKDSARQDALDLIEYANGKSFEELDPETQGAMLEAIKGTNITRGAMENILNNAKVVWLEGRAKKATTSGVSQQEINKYSIPPEEVPTFREYVAQRLGMSPETIDLETYAGNRKQLQAEYEATYGSQEERTSIQQAGLQNAKPEVQATFNTAPDEFKQEYIDLVKKGDIPPGITSISYLRTLISDWEKEKAKEAESANPFDVEI